MNDTLEAQRRIDMCWHFVVLTAVGVSAALLPDMASAAGSNNAIQQVFCNLITILTGATGKAIATVAIIAVGIGALLGKISWGMALIVAVGVALVFGAATIVDALNGGNAGTCAGGEISDDGGNGLNNL